MLGINENQLMHLALFMLTSVHSVLQTNNFKVVYVAPMKALAAEVTAAFAKRLAPLGAVPNAVSFWLLRVQSVHLRSWSACCGTYTAQSPSVHHKLTFVQA